MRLFCLFLITGSLGVGSAHAAFADELSRLRERANLRSAPGAPSTASEGARRREAHARTVAEEAMALYAASSTEPLRWEAALIALKAMRTFIVELKPGYDEAVAARDSARIQSLIVRDEAARIAWETQLDALEVQLFAAPDASEKVLAEAYANAVYRTTLRRGQTAAERWTRCRPLLTAMLQRVSDGVQITRALELVSRFAPSVDPEGWAEMLRRASLSPLPAVSAWATGKANVETAKVQSIDLKFTALDGREVDLRQWRGKVVLLDFWATWCGPCKAELPNILAAYRTYHSRGFEVVAISLDSEKDRSALVEYIREHDLPWPQHFDGQGWKNEYAVKFGVRAIPAMFLIDQSGRIASTDARGPKLEAEIRRLLQIEDAPPGNQRTVINPDSSPTTEPARIDARDTPPVPPPAVGAPAPDFVSYDRSGAPVRISDFRGKVLILDFWATWCGPCIASMPHTQEVARRYADQDVVVLAVCTGDRRKRFEDWTQLRARDYPALRFTFDPHEQGTPQHDQRASWALYGIPAIPTQIVIDREGRVAGSTTGYRPGDRSLERALAAAGVKVEPAPLAQPDHHGNGRTTSGERRTMTLTPPAEGSGTALQPATARRTAPPFTEKVGKVATGDLVADVDFRAVDGTNRRLSDYRGRPLVVFFSTAEMIPDDYLNGILATYGAEHVRVLAIITRDQESSFKAWQSLHESRAHRFGVAFDPVPISEARNGVINRIFQFGAPTPFSIVIDGDGRFIGAFPWKLPQGQQGLAELLRRAGVPVSAADSSTGR
jgi:thiol-disulfide isomerase/thioredoxin